MCSLSSPVLDGLSVSVLPITFLNIEVNIYDQYLTVTLIGSDSIGDIPVAL